MASVDLVSPQGTTRTVTELGSLQHLVNARGFKVASGTYADAVATLSGWVNHPTVTSEAEAIADPATPLGAAVRAANAAPPGPVWVGAYTGTAYSVGTLSAAFTAASTVVQTHQLALDCTDLQVVLPWGWFTTLNATADSVMVNGVPAKVAIQVGSALYPVTFQGVRSKTCDPGGYLVSDPLGGYWAKGSQLRVRMLMGAISGQAYPAPRPAAGPGITAASPTGWTQNSDVVDSTANAATALPTDSLWGAGLKGRPLVTKPFVLGCIGDSISDGTGDTGGTGYSWITRAANATVPLFRFTRTGIMASSVPASRYSLAMLTGCSHVVVQPGVNDIQPGTRTFAQVTADLSACYRAVAAHGAKAVGFTITPKTSSTDAWATVGNQTIDPSFTGGASSVRSQVNAWIRAGADGLIKGYIEAADAVETARDSGIWKANLSSDGLHPNSAGHAAIAAAVNLTAIAAL